MRVVPWMTLLIAAVLLLTPTYGIGVALAPMTLWGAWLALRSPRGPTSSGVKVGAGVNLALVAVVLGFLAASRGLNGWVGTGMALFVLPAALVIRTFIKQAV